METKHPNFICPICGSTTHYAKGLCRSCYARELSRKKSGKADYPKNLIMKIGILEEYISQDMKIRMDQLIDSNIFSTTNKAVLIGMYKEHKTIYLLAEELGCTKQNVSSMHVRALEKFRSTICLDYLYGIHDLDTVVNYYMHADGAKKRHTSDTGIQNDENILDPPTASEILLKERINEYDNKLKSVEQQLYKIHDLLKENAILKDIKGFPASAKRSLGNMGIKTMSDLLFASKVLPHSRVMHKRTYAALESWAESVGITLGEELGIKPLKF